jgi:hypothetical protein
VVELALRRDLDALDLTPLRREPPAGAEEVRQRFPLEPCELAAREA